jgi:hypothetical protein
MQSRGSESSGISLQADSNPNLRIYPDAFVVVGEPRAALLNLTPIPAVGWVTRSVLLAALAMLALLRLR